MGPNKNTDGHTQDKRFYSGWVDVQRLGEKLDYCRMVYPDGAKEEESFFACGLAGTRGLSSVIYRSKSVKDGFKRGRDDYMNRIRGDGRDAYCRILKQLDNTYLPVCIAADDTKFGDVDTMDPEPPEDWSQPSHDPGTD
jgi:hypothetical protein